MLGVNSDDILVGQTVMFLEDVFAQYVFIYLMNPSKSEQRQKLLLIDMRQVDCFISFARYKLLQYVCICDSLTKRKEGTRSGEFQRATSCHVPERPS